MIIYVSTDILSTYLLRQDRVSLRPSRRAVSALATNDDILRLRLRRGIFKLGFILPAVEEDRACEYLRALRKPVAATACFSFL